MFGTIAPKIEDFSDTTIKIVDHRDPVITDPRIYYHIEVKSGTQHWMVRFHTKLIRILPHFGKLIKSISKEKQMGSLDFNSHNFLYYRLGVVIKSLHT